MAMRVYQSLFHRSIIPHRSIKDRWSLVYALASSIPHAWWGHCFTSNSLIFHYIAYNINCIQQNWGVCSLTRVSWSLQLPNATKIRQSTQRVNLESLLRYASESTNYHNTSRSLPLLWDVSSRSSVLRKKQIESWTEARWLDNFDSLSTFKPGANHTFPPVDLHNLTDLAR